MWCGARNAVSALVFIITPPDHAAVFIIGIPYFTPILAAALTTEYLPAKRMAAACPPALLFSLFQLILHLFPSFQVKSQMDEKQYRESQEG